MLGNPALFSPLEISLAVIKERVEQALQENRATWDTGFVLSLRGNFTTVATPGILTGQLTLGTNIGFNSGTVTVKFFGSGSVDIWGIPLGEAAALLDLTDPLNPGFDFAAALPSPRNPLGFLFPAEGVFSIRLRTTGMLEAPLLALGVFVDEGSRGVLGVAQTAFGQLLDRFAADLRAERNPIVRLRFLDTNDDGVVSAAESSRTIDRAFVTARLLGDTAQGLSAILPVSIAAFAPDQLQRTGVLANLILADLLDAAQRTNLGLNAAQALLDVLARAAGDAIAAGWTVFNPELAIQGLVQPQVLGFPLGPATERIELILSKQGLSFAYQTSLIEMVKRSLALVPFATQMADLVTLGFSDRIELGFTLNFPDVGRFANLLARGSDGAVDLADFIVDTINPFGNWEVLLRGEMRMIGFRLAEISGFFFAPQLDDNGGFLPSGLFGSRVFNLDPDGDGRPNQDLADSVAQIEGAIPVNTKTEYENMMRFGGLVLTGQLFLPKLLRDPVDLLMHDVNWQLPTVNLNDPLQAAAAAVAYQQWVNDFATDLTQEDVWARLQVYLPSPAELFDLGDYLGDHPQANTYGGGDSGAPEIKSTARARPLDEVLTNKITQIFNATYLEGFVDLQLLSIGFGHAEISVNASALRVTAEIPWLSGLTATFEIKRQPQNLNAVLRDLAGSPLVSTLVAPFLPAGQSALQTFSVLLDPRIAQIQFDLPVAAFEIEVSSAPLTQWLTDSFGLPATLFQSAEGAASELFIGAYTPGFGGAQATGVERYGGFRLEAHLNISGLVSNAQFVFEVELFNLDDPASFLVPNFVARASVDRLGLAGFGEAPGLLVLDNFIVEIARQPTGVTIGLGGRLTVLNQLHFIADGRFTVDLAPGGGIFGQTQLSLEGSGAANATLSGNLFNLSGVFFWQLNTTATPRTIDLPNTPAAQDPIVDPQSAQLRVAGSLTAGTFNLSGSFFLSAQPNQFLLKATATLSFAPFGSLDVTGNVILSPAGLAGSFSLNAGAQVTRSSTGIEFQATLQLDLNTQASPQTISRPAIDPATGAINGAANVSLAPNTSTVFLAGRLQLRDETGALSFAMFGGFSATVGQVTIQGSGTETGLQLEFTTVVLRLAVGGTTLANLSMQGAMVTTTGGVAARIGLGIGAQTLAPAGAGYTLNGSFTLEVNSRGAPVTQIGSTPVSLAAGPYFRVAVGGSLTVASFLMEGVVALKVAASELALSGTVTSNLKAGNTTILSVSGSAALSIRDNGMAGRFKSLGHARRAQCLGILSRRDLRL